MQSKTTKSSKGAARLKLEGKVLEILVRINLMPIILASIGLTDQLEDSMFWGCVGAAGVDAGALARETMVLVSCKRDVGRQKFNKVLLNHLKKFADSVNAGFSKYKANKGKSLEKDNDILVDNSYRVKWRKQYIYENVAAQYLDAVKLALHFVAVSINK
ncbi:hypothetical protein L7F22_062353 [Adiantum nelumboides]|nr:hypothetical protein [Adiantum nelumboides]